MAGFTDSAFRKICIGHGADYCVTEMISAKALIYRDLKTAQLAKIEKCEMPTAVQIFGSEPQVMANAAKMIEDGSYEGCASECRPAAIDINMGCPVRKIVSNGEGSALLLDHGRVKEIVRAVKEAVSLPVTVKIRTGFDERHKNAEEIAEIIEEAGADALCVHGRTRERMYMPGVDHDAIRRVKETLSIPVIANGDIYTPEDALYMKEHTGCDALMIARGALGNPFIFERIKDFFAGGSAAEPDIARRVETAKRHLSLMVSLYGEERGTREARKHIAWYIKGFPGASAMRDRINRADRSTEIVELLSGCL